MARTITQIADDIDGAVVSMIRSNLLQAKQLHGADVNLTDESKYQISVVLDDGREVSLRALADELRNHPAAD